MKSIKSALAASLVLATVPAIAADTGFYIGGGLGQTGFSGNIDRQIAAAYAGNQTYEYQSSRVIDDSDSGYKLFGGYRFLPWLGVELAWQDLGETRTNYVLNSVVPLTNATATVDGKYQLSGATLTVFGEWSLNDQFSLIARAGAFNGEVEYSEAGIDGTGTAYTFRNKDSSVQTTAGVGVNWRMTPAWDLRLDYDRYFDIGERFALTETGNGRFDHVDLLSLNLAYRFGR